MFKCRNILLPACAALMTLMSLSAGKPGAGGDRTVPPGTIYYYADGQVYAMKADGSGKTLISGLGRADRGYQASRCLHGGRRWFLQVRPAEFPADDFPEQELGVAQYEIWVVSTDGTAEKSWQLTTDPDLRPYRLDSAEWMPGDEGISFSALRWEWLGNEFAGEWMPVEAGVYTMSLTFDEASLRFSAGEPQLRVRSDIMWANTGHTMLRSTIVAHDWNPDASALVYTNYTSDGMPRGLTVLTLADPMHPVALTADAEDYGSWSPDGSLIAYHSNAAQFPGTITLVDPNGQNRRVLYRSADNSAVLVVGWSPDSKHVLFKYSN